MMSQCAAWLWVSKLAHFVMAVVGIVSIVRMAVVVVAAGDMAAGCMAEAAEVAVGMARKVS